VQAWKVLECGPLASADSSYQAAWRTYQQSLAHMIPAASRFGRLDPRAHLIINDNRGRRAIGIRYFGFPWRPADFCQVIPASEFRGREVRRHYGTPGLGTSLVAVRRAAGEEPFLRSAQPLAVTAVLRPARWYPGRQTMGMLPIMPVNLRRRSSSTIPFSSTGCRWVRASWA